MARLTMVFGVLLIAVAVGAYFIAGGGHTGMLHPAGLGLLLVVCGALGHTHDLKRRALWMHIAVLVGLIGVGFGLKGAIQVFGLAHQVDVAPAVAIGIEERAVVCLISLIFVAFCVRNFIQNRRQRIAGA